MFIEIAPVRIGHSKDAMLSHAHSIMGSAVYRLNFKLYHMGNVAVCAY
jgi:hypothetical protein